MCDEHNRLVIAVVGELMVRARVVQQGKVSNALRRRGTGCGGVQEAYERQSSERVGGFEIHAITACDDFKITLAYCIWSKYPVQAYADFH